MMMIAAENLLRPNSKQRNPFYKPYPRPELAENISTVP
jgi:hypothetical protein